MWTSLTSLLFIHSHTQADKYAIKNLCFPPTQQTTLQSRTESPFSIICMSWYSQYSNSFIILGILHVMHFSQVWEKLYDIKRQEIDLDSNPGT